MKKDPCAEKQEYNRAYGNKQIVSPLFAKQQPLRENFVILPNSAVFILSREEEASVQYKYGCERK
jgi:hypothetical protein